MIFAIGEQNLDPVAYVKRHNKDGINTMLLSWVCSRWFSRLSASLKLQQTLICFVSAFEKQFYSQNAEFHENLELNL